MLTFLGGFLLGTTFGIFIMAVVTMAKETDRGASILVDMDDAEHSIRRRR
jgi:hypothetical protein